MSLYLPSDSGTSLLNTLDVSKIDIIPNPTEPKYPSFKILFTSGVEETITSKNKEYQLWYTNIWQGCNLLGFSNPF